MTADNDGPGLTPEEFARVETDLRKFLFHHPQTIVLHRTGAEPENITRPAIGGGYAHELIEVTECLLAGRTESAVMPLADTLAVQTVLNTGCEQLGVRHAEDTSVVV